MAEKQLKYVVTGEDRSASKTLAGVAEKAEGSGKRIGSAFSKVGGMIGGEFGEILNKVGEGFDSLGEKGAGVGKKMMAGGAGLAGVGALLTGIGSAEKEATNQLSAAITASGGSISDYKDEIEKSVKSQEKFAHSAKDTKSALTVLTEATNDPKKALDEMGVVANLAAAKHESLAAAAEQVAKILGGGGARTLKAYGITMESAKQQAAALTSAEKAHESAVKTLAAAQKHLTDLKEIDNGKTKLSVSQQIALRDAHNAVATAEANVTTTAQNLGAAQKGVKSTAQDANDAIAKLSTKLSGQASASVDSWGGKIRVLRTQLGDWVGEMGQKYGPAITGVGTALMAAGMVTQAFATRSAAAAQAASAAAQLSATEQVAANTEIGASAVSTAVVVEGAAADEVAASEAAGAASALALGPVGIAIGAIVGVGALAAGALHLFGSKAHEATKPTVNFTDAILSDNDALGMNTRKLAENTLQKQGLYDLGVQLGISQKTLTDASMGNASAVNTVTAAIRLGNKAYEDNYNAVVGADKAAGIQRTAAAQELMIQNRMTDSQKKAYNAAQKLSEGFGGLTASMNTSKHAADNISAADDKATSSLTKFQQVAAKKIAARLEAVDHLSPKAAQARALLLALDGATVTSYLDVQQRLVSNAKAASGHRTGGGALYTKITAGGSEFYDGGGTSIAEREPELVTMPGYANLPRGSKVTPLSRLHGGGGGAHFTVQLVAPQVWAGSSPQLARHLVSTLEEWLRSGGGIEGLKKG